MSAVLSLLSCFSCLHLGIVCAHLLCIKTLITASFLLQCVCGRWMWQCPRAAFRWLAAKRPSCPAPSPPALPSTTSTSSGWWYHCPMPTSQSRYSVHHLCTHSEQSFGLFSKKAKLEECCKAYPWYLDPADSCATQFGCYYIQYYWNASKLCSNATLLYTHHVDVHAASQHQPYSQSRYTRLDLY